MSLRPSLECAAVYLYVPAVDMRKSINTLSVLVEGEMGMNPFDEALYVFANRRRDKLKILTWERTGFVLYYKRLEKQRFHWPRTSEERVRLSGQEINWLLDGYNLAAMRPHETLPYQSVLGL
jgi:transposase